eukprot:TRINITY_DN8190_c0_g1_i10.p1 TRINITY_DN8190_c0_g1~~TRINITY_DN8190_c0_g1_i10.p1  ORF type:complete len:208 (+),score=51.24 TRINITY_DN8190_c0_g1_i10:875-1498(+)
MLEKTASRRPFIGEIVEMFPKPSYRLRDPLDIDNFVEYRKQRPREPQTKVEKDLEMEFQLLKNELLDPEFLVEKSNDFGIAAPGKHFKTNFISNQSEKGMKIIKRKREPRWIVAGTYYSHISTERQTAVNFAKRDQSNLLMRRIADQTLNEDSEKSQERSTRNVKGRLIQKEYVTSKMPLRLNESCNKITKASKERLVFMNNCIKLL